MKNSIPFKVLILGAIVFSSCSILCPDKLHWYYKSDSTVDVKNIYFSTTSCRMLLNNGKIDIHPSAVNPLDGFLPNDTSFFNLRDDLWDTSHTTKIHDKLCKYLKWYKQSQSAGILSGIQRAEISAPNILGENDCIGVYPSLSFMVIKDKKDKPEYRSVVNLAKAAQQEYLKQLVSNRDFFKDSIPQKYFMNVLVNSSDKLKKKKDTASDDIDDSTRTIQVILSTQNLSSEPGDRIVKATYRIYSRDFTFEGWDNAKSQWQSMDLGSADNTQASNFSLTGGVGKDSVNGVSATYGTSDTQEEKYNFTKRYVLFAGGLNRHEILFFQEGEQGIDLSGSLNFTAKIKLNNPKAPNNNLILLESTFTIRHMLKRGNGRRTYLEGDDNAEYITFTVVKPYLYSNFADK